MLGQRQLIVILGLSRGGTNHLAQRVHACEGVAGFTEGMSRLIQPTRRDDRQIVRREAIENAVLQPRKSPFELDCWSFNKVNYALQSYPEAWARFLAEDDKSQAVVLIRNPVMIHRSRLQYVRAKKPQRTRWLETGQLMREWRGLLALAWRLPNAVIAFHEQSLADGHAALLGRRLGLRPTTISVPQLCRNCGSELTIRPRDTDAGRAWLYCERCGRFIEGEGDYNFLRDESDIETYRTQEKAAWEAFGDLRDEIPVSLGRRVFEYFVEGRHWHDTAGKELRHRLDGDADRWREIQLNEILYPY